MGRGVSNVEPPSHASRTLFKSHLLMRFKPTKPTKVEIEVLWSSSVDEGMQLMIIPTGDAINGVLWPLATILADEVDERLFLEIYTEVGPVRIPLDQIQPALDAAPGQVHSERWYKENGDRDDPPT